MHHFVRQRRQNFGDRPGAEVRRVEGDLVGKDTVSAGELITDKIAVGAPAALQGDKGIGEGIFEQGAIKRLVGELQGIVSLVRRLCCLSVCVGHWSLRFDLPDSGPLWDVHHSVGMFTTRSNFDPSGDIAKMEQADSAFPRTNLAVWIVVCITEHQESAAVLARFNSLPVQSKYGRTEPIAFGTHRRGAEEGSSYRLRPREADDGHARIRPRSWPPAPRRVQQGSRPRPSRPRLPDEPLRQAGGRAGR